MTETKTNQKHQFGKDTGAHAAVCEGLTGAFSDVGWHVGPACVCGPLAQKPYMAELVLG